MAEAALLSAGGGSSLAGVADEARARVVADRGLWVQRRRCRAFRSWASAVHLRRKCWQMIRQSASPPKARHDAVHVPALQLHPRSCRSLHGLTRTRYPARWAAAVSAPAE